MQAATVDDEVDRAVRHGKGERTAEPPIDVCLLSSRPPSGQIEGHRAGVHRDHFQPARGKPESLQAGSAADVQGPAARPRKTAEGGGQLTADIEGIPVLGVIAAPVRCVPEALSSSVASFVQQIEPSVPQGTVLLQADVSPLSKPSSKITCVQSLALSKRRMEPPVDT